MSNALPIGRDAATKSNQNPQRNRVSQDISIKRYIGRYFNLARAMFMNEQHNGIYVSDSLALLERMESEQVTLAYVDPPTPFSNAAHSLVGLHDRSDNERQKGENQQEKGVSLEAHLSFMTKVLQQVRRVLNHRGSVFFQSEHHLAGDYRQILDAIFGREHFHTDIIWPSQGRNRNAKGLRTDHHTIFLYNKTQTPVYNQPFKHPDIALYPQQDAYGHYRLKSLLMAANRTHYCFEWKGFTPPSGRSWHYSKEQLDALDQEGKIVQRSYGQEPRLKKYHSEAQQIMIGTVWNDIAPVRRSSQEDLGFQTQRPLMLLDRIIHMGSNSGDLVLDPFCGAGTALVSAQLNGRKWLGCDLSPEAYTLAVQRIENECRLQQGNGFAAGDQSTLEQNFPVIYETYTPIFKNAGKRAQPARFVLNELLPLDETRHVEYKEISTTVKPLERIKDIVEEYALAFLNSEGGQIFWGVRDTDRIVTGVKLTSQKRDELRRAITQKLGSIQPAIAPTAFRVELYQVYQDDAPLPDIYVVQVTIPATDRQGLYYTSSGKTYIRVDGSNESLSGVKLEAELRKRFNIGQE